MSETHWSVEGFDRSGQTFVHVRHATADEVAKLIPGVLNDKKIGGIVIYRSTDALSNERSSDDLDEEGLGVVMPTDEPVAGGNRRFTYCRYCQTTGGHTADCWLNS